MSNAVYPSFPGLKFGVTRSPEWSTTKKRSVSGREFRAANMLYPDYSYKLSYEFLRDIRGGVDELRQIVGFFNARQGDFDSFLFTDPDDSVATLESFGTGNGATTQFQLVRSFGGFVEPVLDLNSTPQIFKAGVLQTVVTNYSISPTGLVTFTAAPTSGQALTWSGTFYRRVRFEKGMLEMEKFLYQLWQTRTVELSTVKA